MPPKKATTTVRRSVRVAKRALVSTQNDNIEPASTTSETQSPTEHRAANVVGGSRHVRVKSRKATELGIKRGAIGKVRTKTTTSGPTERRQLQLSEESDTEGLVDGSFDNSTNNAVASSQGREGIMTSREDEARRRRSSHERIQHGDYRSQSATAQFNDHVTMRERTASRGRESRPSASTMGPHASRWRGATESSGTNLDCIGEPATSWREADATVVMGGRLRAPSEPEVATPSAKRQVSASRWREASPAPDRTRSHHTSSWREAPTFSGVRPEQYDSDSQHQERFRAETRRRSFSAQCAFREHQAPRRVDQSIEMPRFDGTGDLELFLRRFQTLAEYFDWRGEEKLFRLKNCIRDDAQYVLMDLGNLPDVDHFIQALKSRFGTTAHAERYRTELSQLRRGTFTLEQLHLKVRSLVSKAAPGPWTALTEIYARDAFLSALGDDDLRRRIMMTCPPPETLSAAFDLALRAVAVDKEPTKSSSEHHEGRFSQSGRRYARAVVEKATSLDDRDVRDSSEMRQLKEANQNIQRELEEMRAAMTRLQGASKVSDSSYPPPQRQPPRFTGPSTQRRLPRDECRRCGGKGHWAKDCQSTVGPTAPSQPAAPSSFGNARVNNIKTKTKEGRSLHHDTIQRYGL